MCLRFIFRKSFYNVNITSVLFPIFGCCRKAMGRLVYITYFKICFISSFNLLAELI